MGIELEQKYVVDSPRPWVIEAELLALMRRGGYAVTFLAEGLQEDTYYDTPEDSLLLEDSSLRLRRKGEGCTLTIKLPLEQQGATFVRREEELVLGSNEDPGAFVAQCLPRLALPALAPVAQVENLRRTYEVAGVAGCRFELAFDDVTFLAPNTGRTARERQVEIERVTGTEGDLARLVGATAGRIEGLHGLTDSKYQRARRLAGAGPA